MATSCYYCGRDLSGLDLKQAVACPGCGTSTDLIKEGRVCPECLYAFEGLDITKLERCPECGTRIDRNKFCRLWSRESTRYWRKFRFAPFVAAAIPGALVVVTHAWGWFVLQPVLAFLVCKYLASRAVEVDDVAAGRRTNPAALRRESAFEATMWVLKTTPMLVIVGLMAKEAIRRFF